MRKEKTRRESGKRRAENRPPRARSNVYDYIKGSTKYSRSRGAPRVFEGDKKQG
jgi:hypothetical protein